MIVKINIVCDILRREREKEKINIDYDMLRKK